MDWYFGYANFFSHHDANHLHDPLHVCRRHFHTFATSDRQRVARVLRAGDKGMRGLISTLRRSLGRQARAAIRMEDVPRAHRDDRPTPDAIDDGRAAQASRPTQPRRSPLLFHEARRAAREQSPRAHVAGRPWTLGVADLVFWPLLQKGNCRSEPTASLRSAARSSAARLPRARNRRKT